MNGGSGTIADQTGIALSDTAVPISMTEPTRDNYNFKGWAYTSSATSGNAELWTEGQSSQKTVSMSTLISAAAGAGQSVSTSSPGTVTLYAVWQIAKVYFQDANSCSTIPTGTTGNLRDSRDNQDYNVYRWGSSAPSGMTNYCIMTQDLSLGYGTSSALSLSTDKSAGSGTVNYVNSANNGNGWSTDNSDSNLQYTNGPKSGSETYSSHSYYSYGAAQIVCPKGWAPPTKAQYDNIASFMGGNNATGSSTIRNSTYNFVYGGLFNSSGWNYVGSYGYYWSSTQDSSSYGYYLYFSSSNLSTSYNYKNLGLSVRCVAQ